MTFKYVTGTHFVTDVIKSIYLEKGLGNKEWDHVISRSPFEIPPPFTSPQGMMLRVVLVSKYYCYILV